MKKFLCFCFRDFPGAVIIQNVSLIATLIEIIGQILKPRSQQFRENLEGHPMVPRPYAAKTGGWWYDA